MRNIFTFICCCSNFKTFWCDKEHTMEDRWLTVDEICKYLSVTNETVYKWIDQRGMPGHRVGRRWMFKQEEIDSWVRSGGAGEGMDKTAQGDTSL